MRTFVSVTLLMLACVVAAPNQVSAQTCEHFTGDSSPIPGYHRPSPWTVYIGSGLPLAGAVTLENALDFYIQPYPVGNESVYVPGTPASLKMTPVLGDGVTLPTYFSFWLLAGAGDADVVAYDAENNVIFIHTVSGSSDEVVVIDEGQPIARIEVDRGDNETWIDDLCIAP